MTEFIQSIQTWPQAFVAVGIATDWEAKPVIFNLLWCLLCKGLAFSVAPVFVHTQCLCRQHPALFHGSAYYRGEWYPAQRQFHLPEIEARRSKSESYQLETRNWNNGVYFIELNAGGETLVRKLVVSH